MITEKLLVERGKQKHSLDLITDRLVHLATRLGVSPTYTELPAPTTDLEGFLKDDYLNNKDMENKINRIEQLITNLESL